MASYPWSPDDLAALLSASLPLGDIGQSYEVSAGGSRGLAAHWLVRSHTAAASWADKALASARRDETAPNWSVAIGAFDGVHRGHRQLVARCAAEGAQRGCGSVVVLFDPDPAEILAHDAAPLRLLGIRDRMRMCLSLGVDAVCAISFDRRVASMTPAAYLESLNETLGGDENHWALASVCVGGNFRFGAGARGDAETLRTLGNRYGFAVLVQPLLEVGGQPVSSTRIRQALAAGQVGEANDLLARAHFVRGTVVHGRGEGTTFGFPTANVTCDESCCMPSEGVYACVVSDGAHAWPAAANVGAPPTFAEARKAFLEANLLGFSGDLYGRDVAVLFVEWLRGSRRFSSLEELERTVLGNIDWVRTHVGATAVEVSV